MKIQVIDKEDDFYKICWKPSYSEIIENIKSLRIYLWHPSWTNMRNRCKEEKEYQKKRKEASIKKNSWFLE